MEPEKRIVVNTIAQYSKSVINTCLSLFTVRIVLSALGQSDYGMFNLIAGVISMIGFITNALVITTQRHLSFYQGQGNKYKVQQVFSNSLLIHIIICLGLSVIMLSLMDYLCMDYLNIEDSRRETAKFVYIMAVCMLLITFISAPFKSLFIAHENIIYISVIEVIDAILKLLLALALLQLNYDKLKVYSCIMMLIVLFQLFAYVIYAIVKYKECRLSRVFADFDNKCVKELMGFATWTTFGMGSVLCRQQGLAILINIFFGTIYNAAYGIANQIYGSLSFIITSITNAMNPQIMKAEGNHERDKMLSLACKESKFIVAIMALVFIPLIFEMDNVLKLWLEDVPAYTCFFCQCIFIAFLIDQMTQGQHSAVQAIGNIGTYTLLVYTPKLVSIIVFAIILYYHGSLDIVMYIYIAIEAIVAYARLVYLKKSIGYNIREYIEKVIMKLLPLFIILIVLSVIQEHIWDSTLRFLITIPVIICFGGIVAWYITLTSNERKLLIQLIRKK